MLLWNRGGQFCGVPLALSQQCLSMDSEGGQAWLAEAEVMSEVHLGTALGVRSTVSVFTISLPSGRGPAVEKDGQGLQGLASSDDEGGADGMVRTDGHDEIGTDEHGDLVLTRRPKKHKAEDAPADAVVVHHHVTTLLPQVGLQIWRGALVLSDFILHVTCTSEAFKNVIALELGSGTGLAGLVMGRVAPLVFVTDIGEDILENCSRNVIQNASSLSNGEATVKVRELDWQKPWPPPFPEEENCPHSDKMGPYQWTPEEVKDAGAVSVLLAADVVYSEDLTTSFFNILKKLMPPKSDRVLYLAMEKRYNFSLTDMDVVAHGYKHFRTFFTSDDIELGCALKEGGEGQPILDPEDSEDSDKEFFGRKIVIDEIPQYVRNYSRGDDLELWEIRPRKGVWNVGKQ